MILFFLPWQGSPQLLSFLECDGYVYTFGTQKYRKSLLTPYYIVIIFTFLTNYTIFVTIM